MRERLSLQPQEENKQINYERIAFGFSIEHRVRIAQELSKATGAEALLTIDDVAWAVPEKQRPLLKALPGYERHILFTLLMSLGFEKGGTAIVTAPLNPVEMAYVYRIYKRLKDQFPHLSFSINFNYDGEFKNLLEIYEEDPEAYARLCKRFNENLPEINEYTHISLASRFLDIKFSKGGAPRILVWPFQMTEFHLQEFGRRENVVMPSIPNPDKARFNLTLKEAGANDIIPTMDIISSTGIPITTIEELENFQGILVEASTENILRWAEVILQHIDNMAQEKGGAYLKLDSNGVSGLGNLTPNSELGQIIYNPNMPYNERLYALVEFIKSYDYEYLPPFAVVEELVTPRMVEGVKYDVTVGGVAINGEFYPTIIYPMMVNDNDEFAGGWTGADPSKMNENPQIWKELYSSFSRLTQILKEKAGYKTGLVACDVLVDETGNIYIHDPNLRRGGRSFLEALVSLQELMNGPRGFFEAEIKLKSPKNLTPTQRFILYTKICEKVAKQGWFPFSTAFGYYTDEVLKFKFAVPLTNSTIAGLPRNMHYVAVNLTVNEIYEEALQELLSN